MSASLHPLTLALVHALTKAACLLAELLAASLASEQQLSPSSSPPRAGRLGAPWPQPRPLNSAGVGPGHYFTRSYSGRSLAAAAAASAAALGVASAEQQQEEVEAGLETLQDWMSNQG